MLVSQFSIILEVCIYIGQDFVLDALNQLAVERWKTDYVLDFVLPVVAFCL